MRRAKKRAVNLSNPGLGAIGQPGVAAARVKRGGAVGSTPSPLSSPHNDSYQQASYSESGGHVNVTVGVDRYHDYRIGAMSAADAVKTSRPAVPRAPVGSGSGFRGV